MSPHGGNGLMKAMTWKRRARCRIAVSVSHPTTFSTLLIRSPVTSVSLAHAPLLRPSLVRADKWLFFPAQRFHVSALFLFSIDSKGSWQEQMALCSLHIGYINP